MAQLSDVFPTPPFPVKNRNLGGDTRFGKIESTCMTESPVGSIIAENRCDAPDCISGVEGQMRSGATPRPTVAEMGMCVWEQADWPSLTRHPHQIEDAQRACDQWCHALAGSEKG
jgi:hypothetical protein